MKQQRTLFLVLFLALLLIGCAESAAEADNPANVFPGSDRAGVAKLGRSTLTSDGCVRSAEYWQSNPAAWPVDSLTVGGANYSREELQAVLSTPLQDDATTIVAHQLIAAKINTSNQADAAVVADTIAAADAWLAAHPLGSNPGGPEREQGLALMQRLGEYNNGLLGPVYCSQGDVIITGQVTVPTPTLAAAATPIPGDDNDDDGDEPDNDFDDDGDDDLQAGICASNQQHPHAMTLAGRYDVTYEEIMDWFCAGYGFGEIEHAYMLSQQSGLPVDEIFDLRASGLGWGQIRKQLGGSFSKGHGPGNGPGNGNGNNGNGNGNGNGNNGNNGNGNGNGNNGNGNSNGNNGNGKGNNG